jgi:hypothetical protein
MARKKKTTRSAPTRKAAPARKAKSKAPARKAAAKGRPAGRGKDNVSSNGEGSKLKMNQIMLLKGRAKTTSNALSIKVGMGKFTLPIETTTLESGDVAFCQVKGGSGIYKIDRNGKRLVPVGGSEGKTAYKSLLAAGRGGGGGKSAAQLDEATQNLMRQLEAKLRSQGLKAAVDLKTGSLRAAKPRKRR